jgi:hypothetical protein
MDRGGQTEVFQYSEVYGRGSNAQSTARLVFHQFIKPSTNYLVLGLAKTQWYTTWIKTGALRADTARFHRELHTIHEFLESVSEIDLS